VGFFSGGGFCSRSEDGLSGVVGVDLAVTMICRILHQNKTFLKFTFNCTTK